MRLKQSMITKTIDILSLELKITTPSDGPIAISKNKQDTSHRWYIYMYMCHAIFTGNLVLVSSISLCVAACYAKQYFIVRSCLLCSMKMCSRPQTTQPSLWKGLR